MQSAGYKFHLVYLWLPIVEAAGRAVREARRGHKRAGKPIAELRDGKVVLIPPDEIED